MSLIFVGLLVILTSRANCAPPEVSTQTPQSLTTVQYYVKPTTQRTEPDYVDYMAYKNPREPNIPLLKDPSFTPPQLIMTLLRTALDVIRNVNHKRSNITSKNSTVVIHPKINSNLTARIDNSTDAIKKNGSEGRGIEHEIFYDDLHHYLHDHPPDPTTTTTTEAPKEMMKPRYTDPWSGYYDFIITEGSFKFWSAFQLFTAALLLYSALAAIYYAKFNPIQPDYDTAYDDYFFGRSLEGSAPEPAPDSASPAPGWISSLGSMGTQAFHRIIDTINSSGDKFK